MDPKELATKGVLALIFEFRVRLDEVRALAEGQVTAEHNLLEGALLTVESAILTGDAVVTKLAQALESFALAQVESTAEPVDLPADLAAQVEEALDGVELP